MTWTSDVKYRDDQVSPVFDIKAWKWNEAASDQEQLHKILAALWSEGCLSWLMSIEHKSLYAKLPNKKSWPMRLSKAACIWSSNISRCQVPERKKSLICFVLARDGACGWGTKTFGTNFGSASAACPLIKTRIEWSLFINQSKMLSLQQVLQNITEHNDHLNFLAKRNRRQTRNGQIVLHVFATAISRQGLI